MKKLFYILLLLPLFVSSQQSLATLIAKYEEELTDREAYPLPAGDVNQSSSPTLGFSSGGARQDYYYMSYWLDAEIRLWQITGDIAYFSQAKIWIDAMISDAVPVGVTNTGYLGWTATPSFLSATVKAEGVPLWEFYAFRHVATLLTILHDNPDFVSSNGLTTWYNNTLDFVRVNIFEKWWQNTSSGGAQGALYRSRTHMVSAPMNLAAALDYIYEDGHPDDSPNYATAWQSIAYSGMPNWNEPNSIREQLVETGVNYFWYRDFVSSGSPSLIQDVLHSGDFHQNIHDMYLRGQYWTEADMQRFANTMENLWFQSGVDFDQWEFVDGSGADLSDTNSPNYSSYSALPRFLSQPLQNEMETGILDVSNYNDDPVAGFLAYSKFLNDGGTLVYGNQSVPTPANPNTPIVGGTSINKIMMIVN